MLSDTHTLIQKRPCLAGHRGEISAPTFQRGTVATSGRSCAVSVALEPLRKGGNAGHGIVRDAGRSGGGGSR